MMQNRARIGLFEGTAPELATYLARERRIVRPIPIVLDDACITPGVLADACSDKIFDIMSGEYKKFKSEYGSVAVGLSNYRFAVISYHIEGVSSGINETYLHIYNASDLDNIRLEKEIKSDLIKPAAEFVHYQGRISECSREQRRTYGHLLGKAFPDKVHLAIFPSCYGDYVHCELNAIIYNVNTDQIFKVEVPQTRLFNIVNQDSFICYDDHLRLKLGPGFKKIEIDFSQQKVKAVTSASGELKTSEEYECAYREAFISEEEFKKTEKYKTENYQKGDLEGWCCWDNQHLYNINCFYFYSLGRLGYPIEVKPDSLITQHKKDKSGYPLLQLKSGEILFACQPQENKQCPRIDNKKSYSLKLFDPKNNKIIFDKSQASPVYCSSVDDVGFFLFNKENSEVIYYGDMTILFDFNKLAQTTGLSPSLVALILEYAFSHFTEQNEKPTYSLKT